jgi:sugar O-acyltransferase (sialic acid O-acetyltransferase NeuD family)
MNVIFGASGHAREIAFILRSQGRKLDYFVANDPPGSSLKNVPVITESRFFELPLNDETNLEVFVAIGNNQIRKAVVERIKTTLPDAKFTNLFHSSVIMDELDSMIELGEGNIFFPGTILTTDIKIGNHNHFNSSTSISHNCLIGDFNTISPRTTIAGNVRIGSLNFFGTGAVVINNLSLADNLVIGAGAVIVDNISEMGTYLGVPAKKK